MSEQCPCGSNVSYSSCCEPFHKGTSQPATAEILMKARYSAFVKDNVSFIMDTHDPKTREKQDENEIKQWAKNSEWINLEIKNVEKGGVDDDQGTVEFVANYIINRKNCTHHELSTFKKIDNTWYFNEGEILQSSIKREGPKVGRNDPCPCGSGKKYKKCCL